MHRTLIMAPMSVGDAVASQPLVAALARRGAVVTVAAHPTVTPVYRTMGAIVASVIELPFTDARLHLSARWMVGRGWQRRYDVAYVLQDSFTSALLPWFAQVGRRVGYLGRWRHFLINDGRPDPVPADRQAAAPAAHFLRLAVPDLADAELPLPSLHVAPERIAAALARFELMSGGYWVLVPGARGGAARCWPPAHYAELARQLHAQTGQPIVLLGSGPEQVLAEHIAALLDGVPTRVLAGCTPLDEALALLAGARGMVGNDAGLSAAAAALGVPQAVLYGPTRPAALVAQVPRSRALFLTQDAAPDCAPCGQRLCAQGHLRCLQDIAPARVLDALFEAAGLDVPAGHAQHKRVVGGN